MVGLAARLKRDDLQMQSHGSGDLLKLDGVGDAHNRLIAPRPCEPEGGIRAASFGRLWITHLKILTCMPLPELAAHCPALDAP